MKLLDMLKDVLNVAQKADNIELYKQLLDVNRAALDVQSEIIEIKNENQELKKQLKSLYSEPTEKAK